MKPPTTLSKEQLKIILQQLINGGEQAIDTLYRLYFKRLKAYGWQVTNKTNEELIITVIQEFYIWLVKNHQKLSHVEDIELYLFKSIRFNILSALKKQQQKERVAKKYLINTQSKQAPITPSPEKQFIAQEKEQLQKERLNQVLAQLPTYQKEVLYLRYFQNYSYKDIGKILAVSEQVARNYAYRAIKRMKAELKLKGWDEDLENVLLSLLILGQLSVFYI